MNRVSQEILRVAVIVLCAAAPLGAQTAVEPAELASASPPDSGSGAFLLRSLDAAEAFQQPAGPAPTPRHTGVRALFKDLGSDFKRLPSKENLMWVGIGGGLALAAHPFDDNVNEYMVGNTTAEKFFKPGAVIGQLGSLLGTSLVIYAVGRIGDKPKVSHVGMDLIQALMVTEIMVQPLKYATRRERPDLSGKTSFPSGHAADTFAFATALERHLGWRYAAPAYAIASYVAISRVPANRHWLSDAVFGSAVGVIAGRTVTANESLKFPATVALIPGGVEVMFVRHGD